MSEDARMIETRIIVVDATITYAHQLLIAFGVYRVRRIGLAMDWGGDHELAREVVRAGERI